MQPITIRGVSTASEKVIEFEDEGTISVRRLVVRELADTVRTEEKRVELVFRAPFSLDGEVRTLAVRESVCSEFGDTMQRSISSVSGVPMEHLYWLGFEERTAEVVPWLRVGFTSVPGDGMRCLVLLNHRLGEARFRSKNADAFYHLVQAITG